MRRRHILERAAVAFAIFALAAPAHAQGYPSKPIRLIVGFPPGGGMDLSARVYSAKLQEALDTPIVVENRPGGTGAAANAQIRAGRLRVLAVTSAQRTPLVPDAPTVAESGVPGYDISVWAGLFAPAGTPAAIVSRLYREALRAMNAPDTREKLKRHRHGPGRNGARAARRDDQGGHREIRRDRQGGEHPVRPLNARLTIS
ncbi:MAG TPA: tripartite tricarboxylate transporter substrate-binding protein [Burkholderiales bacterium]|nr:tripartite tricarboxylate transporter substrate-binding protein [Burkholderiales bacterium]